jgi:hypothetical protein
MSEQAAAPAVSADVELLFRMIVSLDAARFDWVAIGASMGLVPATASKRYTRLKDKLIKVLDAPAPAPATPDAGPSPTKRRKVAGGANGATPTKPKAKRGGGAKKKTMSSEHVDDDDELLRTEFNAGEGNLKREFDDALEATWEA